MTADGQASPPALPGALASVRAFGERAGALRVAALLDRGADAEPVLVEWEPGEALAVTVGEETRYVPPGDEGGEPLALADVRRAPPLDVDAESGRLVAPLGALEPFAHALLTFAAVLGGRSVVAADIPAAHGGSVSLAARVGEPLVLGVGEAQFALPDNWP